VCIAAVFALLAAGWGLAAAGSLPSWIANTQAGSDLERVFFRAMALPDGNVLYRRLPAETTAALGELLQKNGSNAELYSLRALEEEQRLDFPAAEADWKLYLAKSANKPDAQLALADFYHRRLRPQDEIATLSAVADAPASDAERFTAAEEQRSWRASQRIFEIIRTQGLGKDVSMARYRAWIARYPQEPQLYSRFLEYLLDQKEYRSAQQVIAAYQKQFPGDQIFGVKAQALVAYRQGSLQQGLAIYEQTFQPLWDPELVKSYFALLTQTQNLRAYLDSARATLKAHPEDLDATARLFYYYQQQGKPEAAQAAITTLRLRKEAAKSAWTPEELYVCGRLMESAQNVPEAARYYFALYNSNAAPAAKHAATADHAPAADHGNDAQLRALSRLTDLLLTAPEAPIRLGSGDLSIYKDIATLDQGPGYLNGILSLLLNSESPQNEQFTEEQRAFSYFHRTRAAELLALLDQKFPNAAERPVLHAKLLQFYAESGKSEAVLQGGAAFLAAFPQAKERTAVRLRMADADARLGRTEQEFAIYDAALQELAAQADNMPLGPQAADLTRSPSRAERYVAPQTDDAESGDADSSENTEANVPPTRAPEASVAFQPGAAPADTASSAAVAGPRSTEYSLILERYLARLAERKQIPQALGVLRREIDHHPEDPGLYERLAVFLEQNEIGAEQEEIYRRAMARFPDRSWYHKLARYYLRRKDHADFEKLTREAIRQFDGSELQTYFATVGSGTASLYVRLNQYAHARFPHNPYFVRNLLGAYQAPRTWNQRAWEALLREHWFEEPDLRNEYFSYLSARGSLEKELAALQSSPTPPAPDLEPSPAHPEPRAEAPGKDQPDAPVDWQQFVRGNPAAGQYLAQLQIWRSHFEESAPVLRALAVEYPADVPLGRTASSVYRSLAYFVPGATAVAVKLEENLLAADPANRATLARIGDIYADRELFAQAAPYWERIPKTAPGEPGGYLAAATIYWDYYDFDQALRLLDAGRKQFGDAHLYGYEEGALYEGKREYARAVHEYAAAAVGAAGDSPALFRLLDLARRPKFRDLVNDESARLATDAQFSAASVQLRVRVLETEERKPELLAFLNAAVDRATTLEQAAQLETLAQQKSLEAVRQHALEKQVALATDPVTRLQLRYELVRLYEGRKDFASAQRNSEVLYRENPKILGVVRATVDFDWRVKRYPQGLEVLQQASRDAYPELGKKFAFEAARKATESRQFSLARDLLAPLLKQSPYDSEYLAALADTYAQAGDPQGLKQFYLDEIAQFKGAPLSDDDRRTRIAALRRGLIPALTQLQDYPGAVEQYIEILNNFPDDEGLAGEAALYAQQHKRSAPLVSFYSKTLAQSPRNYRWGQLLGRIYTSLEDYPAAIDAYGKAIAVRPDGSDLRLARATLAERLLRFDDAANDYAQIYQLTYKNPQWMEKIAELRARQGREGDAVTALRIARIDPAPDRASNYFLVAQRLEGWGLLEQARTFAVQGVKLAGGELLAETQFHDGAQIYARIMTRLRQQDEAYATLRAAQLAAASSLAVVQEQAAKEGIAGISDREWRAHAVAVRVGNARSGMQAAMTAMGATVASYFTPEEKTSFAAFAQTMRTPLNTGDADAVAIPLAHSAGLAEEEARWRYELMMRSTEDTPALLARMYGLVQLQRQRLQLAPLGAQLEEFAPRIAPDRRAQVLLAAAEAYRSTGDADNELRMLESVPMVRLGGELQTRYFTLLLRKKPQRLLEIAATWNSWGQQAADFVLCHGDVGLAHALVQARSAPRPAVWEKAYTALVGVYFAEASPGITRAFLQALGEQTIGQRIGTTVNRNEQLAGDVWFYYGARYGEYLGNRRQPAAEDFLPSLLEQSPASPLGYVALGDDYAERGEAAAAIAEYRHALELAPGQADVHDRIAVVLDQQGRREDALVEWKSELAVLSQQMNTARVPESYWNDFGHLCEHLHSRKLFAEVRPEVDALLRAYIRRNGNYRSQELLRSGYAAIDGPPAATAWLLEMTAAAREPLSLLSEIADAPWIHEAQRGAILKRLVQLHEEGLAKSEGLAKENAQSELLSWQVRWMQNLLATKQFAPAKEYLATLPHESGRAEDGRLVALELRMAAHDGTLEPKIAGYRAAPEVTPTAEVLRNAAQELITAGDRGAARTILEFVFAREIAEHRLDAANFLGLAEIRLASGDTPGAVALLQRLAMVAGDAYANMDAAAALLEKTGHYTEAVAFLEPLWRATPWDSSLQLRLAKAQIAAGQLSGDPQNHLEKIAAAPRNLYSQRVAAALALSGSGHGAELGSAELQLLEGNGKAVGAGAADEPFFYDARLQAARNESDPRQRIQILTQALADTPFREDARLPLFEAAAAVHADPFALEVINPILREQRIRENVVAENSDGSYGNDAEGDSGADAASGNAASGFPGESSGDNSSGGANDNVNGNSDGNSDASADASSVESTDAREEDTRSANAAALPVETQARLGRTTGLLLARLQRFGEALGYLQAAEKLETSAARRRKIAAEIRDVRARLQREQQNAARQPILHEALEQDHRVRPKLIAGAAPSAATRKTEVQP
jgi:Flp pilus assembly protein TadD